jgi:hypothetical protein
MPFVSPIRGQKWKLSWRGYDQPRYACSRAQSQRPGALADAYAIAQEGMSQGLNA